jgi:hypothetical protein
MIQPNGGDTGEPEALGGLDPTVAGNDAIVTVDQDLIDEAELADRGRDLGDLLIGVGARVPGIGFQSLYILIANFEIQGCELL